jgi:hypothetical protein
VIGVIVGALVASLGDFALERRRERSEVRRAARLVLFELVHVYGVLSTASIEKGEFPSDK